MINRLHLPLLLLPLLVLHGRAQSVGDVTVERVFSALMLGRTVDIQPMPGRNRLCVVDQHGRILGFDNRENVGDAVVMLDIRDRVSYIGELGLLGLAFAPDFAESRTFYVHYNAGNHQIPDDSTNPLRSVVSRFRMQPGSTIAADSASEEILLEFRQPYVNHNGGQIRFGADGYLYIASGDGGAGGDPHNNGQNLSTFLAKLLRIDVSRAEGGKQYAIPPDNPFVGSTTGAYPEIYAYGLRNPWRFSFDPVNPAHIWIGDVGEGAWEEVNLQTRPGENFGWSVTEGSHCYKPRENCDSSDITMPVWEYGHNDSGGQSITGGFVYRGRRAPVLRGRYIYADAISGRIWALTRDSGGAPTTLLVEDTDHFITSFGEDAAGELYYSTINGEIYRFASLADVDREGEEAGGLIRAVAPNPARGSLLLTLQLDRADDLVVTVHDRSGRLLRTVCRERREGGRCQIPVDLSGLPAGSLMLRVEAGERREGCRVELVR